MPGPKEKDQRKNEDNTGAEYQKLIDEMYGRESEDEEPEQEKE